MAVAAMRIALTLPSLAGGGAQRIFVDLARGLLDRSVDVDLVLVRDEGELRDSVPPGAEVVLLGGGPVSRAVPKLARYLRSRRPDVVVPAIFHMSLCTLLAARLVRPRVPVVVSHHNQLSLSARHGAHAKDRVVPWLVRAGYPFADGVVAVSEGVADDLASVAHLPRSGIDVIYNPVDFDRVSAAAAAPVEHPWLAEKTGLVLVAAGRLTAQKDFATLLRAVALLDADVRLVVLGEGELRPELEGLARDLGVDDRVDLPGFCANPYPSYRAADLFVLSSRWEGLPTVLVEALFLGVPIVSTDCPSGPAEILAGGRWGRLVPPGDPTAMAEAIRASLAAGRPLRSGHAGQPLRSGHAGQPLRSGHAGQPPADPAAWERFRLDTVSARWAELLATVARDARRRLVRA
jgi:glycosyltransferase involved in cell wall biosynthesis